MDLKEIYNAIETYHADCRTELYGIMNAFIRAMEAEESLFVITQTVEHNGEQHEVFLILNDEDGHEVFPLFTNMTELNSVKQALEINNGFNVVIMDLKYVLDFLVERQLCDGIVVNPASQNFNVPLVFYEDILNSKLMSHITLIQADITDLYVDAIVSSTDEFLSGSHGVDAAIQRSGGKKLKESVANQRLSYADVMGVDSEGDLKSKYVFFTRGIEYSDDIDPENVFRCYFDCYYHCMNVAEQVKCTSIAFPCLGAGENGVPMNIVIDAATSAVTKWLENHGDFCIDVYFCCYKNGDKEKFQSFFDSLGRG